MASAHFEGNETKIKGGCQSGRKVVPNDSKSDLPLPMYVCTHVVWRTFMLRKKSWNHLRRKNYIAISQKIQIQYVLL